MSLCMRLGFLHCTVHKLKVGNKLEIVARAEWNVPLSEGISDREDVALLFSQPSSDLWVKFKELFWQIKSKIFISFGRYTGHCFLFVLYNGHSPEVLEQRILLFKKKLVTMSYPQTWWLEGHTARLVCFPFFFMEKGRVTMSGVEFSLHLRSGFISQRCFS